MEMPRSSETSFDFQWTAQHNVSEDRTPNIIVHTETNRGKEI
jgi:hypothetical protein